MDINSVTNSSVKFQNPNVETKADPARVALGKAGADEKEKGPKETDVSPEAVEKGNEIAIA